MSTAPALPELQQAFVAAVLGEPDAALADWVCGNGLEPQARLQVYRNVVFNNLTAVLRTAYPAVAKLVGEDFFDGAAARYIRDEPSPSGNLQDYGAGFPAFLAHMPETAELPYLADVAQLDWARQNAYLAADAEAMRAEALASVPESALSSTGVTLHPSVQLIASAYPVWDIWMFCQQDSPEQLDLGGAGQAVLVWREDGQLGMRPLDPGERHCLTALMSGRSLANAYEQAAAVRGDFDLAACLAELSRAELITNIKRGGGDEDLDR